jgi:peptide/nickel transport system permease protein
MNLWLLAGRRLARDRIGVVSGLIVLAFVAIAAASAAGLVARDWSAEVGVSYAPPVFLKSENREESATAVGTYRAREEHGIADPLAEELAEIRRNLTGASATEAREQTLLFGGDKWGRDVVKKAIKGTETSLVDFFNWLYSVFTSIPYLLLVLAIAAVLNQKGIATVIFILGLTGWTGIFRLIRAEYLKHRVREYILAADAIGASHARRMFAHILPNVTHVVLVQLSLHVVLFIKSEVILSFLGFGVGVDTVSWGSMLAEAPSELILGMWWQISAATIAMALAVTAFSLFTDAVRDALDPRLQ